MQEHYIRDWHRFPALWRIMCDRFGWNEQMAVSDPTFLSLCVSNCVRLW